MCWQLDICDKVTPGRARSLGFDWCKYTVYVATQGHNIAYPETHIKWTVNQNSSPPSAAYRCQWTGSALVQIMACRLFGAKPLSKPMLGYWFFRNKLQYNFNEKTNIFIQENASENIVCEMAAILPRERWVNSRPKLRVVIMPTLSSQLAHRLQQRQPPIPPVTTDFSLMVFFQHWLMICVFKHWLMICGFITLLLVLLLASTRFKSWWRHQMETFSALHAICAGNSLVTGEFPAKGQWRGALMFSLICAWVNVWANNREAGDLRRHRAHYDVTVMEMKH